jgi:hypothetical protein
MFHIFNIFSAGSIYFTILKAGENQKYHFYSKTINLYAPKFPNVSKILPDVLGLWMHHSLK